MSAETLVDTHTHVVSADLARYPLQPQPFGVDWYRTDPVDVDGLLGAASGAGVERVVLVQAQGAYGYDCRYVLDAVAGHTDRCVAVVSIDMDGPDPVTSLRALAAHPATGGVRLFGVSGIEPTWLADPDRLVVWQTAQELGLTVVATVFDRHLAPLRWTLERVPQLPVALDHCGFPDIGGGPLLPNAGPLLALADLPNVRLKVSSYLLEQAERLGDPASLVDRLVAVFGGDRLLWGSDYPQTHDRTYSELVALARHSVRKQPATVRAAVLGANAARLWRDHRG